MENEEHPGDEEGAPINEEERELLQQDLTDVQVLKELLGPRGLKGAVFFCPDCDEDHFLGWDLLAGNLKELLEEGESPVHEPAFNPDPHEYVSWDYARGFLDGYESFEEEEIGDLTNRIILELRDRGWRVDEVKGMLAAVGLQLPGVDDDGASSDGASSDGPAPPPSQP
ncbi:MAG: DUF5319 domain-containing protein [Actinomycetota bacterium]|nr:DUF5319 domain-containing protein [Actinomycetota bacterium]